MMKYMELEALYDTLSKNSYTCIYIVQDKKVQFINRQAEIYGGLKAEEIIGRLDSLSFVHPEDQAKARENAIQMLKGQRSSPYEIRFLGRDGRIRWIIETVTPIDFRGRRAVLGNSMDVTELKEARHQIQEFKDLESSILDATPHAIVGLQDRRIIFANNAVGSVFGWKPKDLIGKTTRVFYRSNEEYETVGQRVYKILEKKRNFTELEYPCQRSDGRMIICRINAARIGKYLQSKRIVATYEDITEQKKAETALKERTKQLEIQTGNLEEINIALNVLLKKREDDKKTIEKNILSNINDLITPCMEMVRKNKLDPQMKMFVDTVETVMNNITSPYLKNLSSRYLKLSPRELLVAGLLRDSKTTKEIAIALNTSIRGIEFHREKLRLKLGLKNKKENLVSYLRTLKLED